MSEAYTLANLANIDWIVVTLAVGVLVNVFWVLPGLHEESKTVNESEHNVEDHP